MRELLKTAKSPKYVPDFTASSLQDIDFDLLKKRGIKYIAFDADSTLVPSMGRTLDPETRAFLRKNRPKFTDWCIASNRITNDLLPLAKEIDGHVIRASFIIRKPQRRFFNWVIDYFKAAKPSEIAMVGDKLIADMYGGKKAGMTTIWVEKIGRDNPWDWAFGVRRFEQRMMKHHQQEK